LGSMGEAKVYTVHRYALGLNVLVVIVGAVLIRDLASYIVFAVLGLSSLALFFFAYLGEEKSYVSTVVLGLIEFGYSLLVMLDMRPGAYSALTMAYGVILIVLGALTMSRVKRGKTEGKKALSDFVPPAFG
jgi:predicted membrane protein